MLTDEQIIEAIAPLYAERRVAQIALSASRDEYRAVESAACAERDARIAELERQLEEARKQRQPITEQELRDGRNTVTDDPEEQPEPWAFRMGVCFAERHHGIKDQP